MMSLYAEKLSDLAVIECTGRIVRSDAVFKLRDTVFAQADSPIIVLDLSFDEMTGILAHSDSRYSLAA